jgi:hypothetical protein
MKITIKQLKNIISEVIKENKLNNRKKSSLNESITRATPDELNRWSSGDYGYMDGDDSLDEPLDSVDDDGFPIEPEDQVFDNDFFYNDDPCDMCGGMYPSDSLTSEADGYHMCEKCTSQENRR